MFLEHRVVNALYFWLLLLLFYKLESISEIEGADDVNWKFQKEEESRWINIWHLWLTVYAAFICYATRLIGAKSNFLQSGKGRREKGEIEEQIGLCNSKIQDDTLLPQVLGETTWCRLLQCTMKISRV